MILIVTSATPLAEFAIQYRTELDPIRHRANPGQIHLYTEFSQPLDEPPPPRLVVVGIHAGQHASCQGLSGSELPRVIRINGQARRPRTPFVRLVDGTVSESLPARPAPISTQLQPSTVIQVCELHEPERQLWLRPVRFARAASESRRPISGELADRTERNHPHRHDMNLVDTTSDPSRLAVVHPRVVEIADEIHIHNAAPPRRLGRIAFHSSCSTFAATAPRTNSLGGLLSAVHPPAPMRCRTLLLLQPNGHTTKLGTGPPDDFPPAVHRHIPRRVVGPVGLLTKEAEPPAAGLRRGAIRPRGVRPLDLGLDSSFSRAVRSRRCA